MLWQNANADLPGCYAYRKGENDRSLITSDKQNPTAQPGTDCQIEFRLIQVIISGVTLIVKAWSASSVYLLFNVPANIDPSEWVVLTEH